MVKLLEHLPYYAITKSFIKDIQKNMVFVRAGNIALFSLLSIFPFLILLAITLGFIKDIHDVNELLVRISPYVPEYLYNIIQHELYNRSTSPLTQLSNNIFNIGWHIGLTLFSSSAAARSVLFAFRAISDAHEKIGVGNIVLRSILFVLSSILFFLITSLLASGLIFILPNLPYITQFDGLEKLLQFFVALAFLSVFFNITYTLSLTGYNQNKIGGWLGSIIAACLFMLITAGFAFSSKYFSMRADMYGEYTQLVNLMLWFYLCSIALLMGAQINAFRDERLRK